jgi:hypothetical protein
MYLSMDYTSEMEYDAEILVPFCRKFAGRIREFKRYGLLNTGGRRVLLTAILSGNEEVGGLLEGWGEGVEARAVSYRQPDHVSNIYRFYAELNESSLRSRWLVRVDDDSCTDVGGLLDNLDLFYDWEGKFYLGDLASFRQTLSFGEGQVYPSYRHLLGDLEDKAELLLNEIECGVISRGGMAHMLGSPPCMNLIRQRSELRGGFGDCVTAVAAALSKLHPVQCPFISHLPLISDFSVFGGHLNHIHMVSRDSSGENFQDHEKCGPVQYEAFVRGVDGVMSELEASLVGRKFIMETDSELRMIEFHPDRTAKIKFDDRRHVWTEFESRIQIFCDAREVGLSLKMDGSGRLLGTDEHGAELVYRPVNFA